jgi:hypothetical protein
VGRCDVEPGNKALEAEASAVGDVEVACPVEVASIVVVFRALGRSMGRVKDTVGDPTNGAVREDVAKSGREGRVIEE